MATRSTVAMPFGSVTNVTALNGAAYSNYDSYAMGNGHALYFASQRGTGSDVYRAAFDGGFALDDGGAFGSINTPNEERFPVMTTDELTLYFGSDRAGGLGFDVWKATRSSTADAFANVVNVAEVNSSGEDYPSWISDDGCRLYFASDRDVGEDLYVATRP